MITPYNTNTNLNPNALNCSISFVLIVLLTYSVFISDKSPVYVSQVLRQFWL